MAFSRFACLDDAYAWLDAQINYERALDRVRYDKRTFEIEGFRARMETLGSPHAAGPSIHIAGTRGKGSTALILEALLRGLGCRVAAYTSPHIREYRERIRIDGEPVAPGPFCRALERAAGRIDGAPPPAPSFKTVFEYLTAAFFLAAREAGVDWRVVETGLGGRLDATNVLPPGPVVLTRIDLEHTHLLGSTVAEIAGEKAAILKPGGWAVMGAQSPDGEAEAVFRARTRETGSPIAAAWERCPILAEHYDGLGMALKLEFRGGPLELRLPLYGPWLKENLQAALAALDELAARGAIVAPGATAISRALAGLRLPARMEPIAHFADGYPAFLVDSSHCPLAAGGVARAMAAHFPLSEAVALVGMMADKDGDGFFRSLAEWPGWREVVCYRAPGPRAADPEALASAARRHLPRVRAVADLNTALQSARGFAEKGYRIVATGTMYGVAPIADGVGEYGQACFQTAHAAQAQPQPGPGHPGTQRQAL